MTPRQLLGLCIAVSVFVHIWLIQQSWTPDPAVSGEQIIVPLDFDVAVSNPGDALALEQGVEENDDHADCEKAARRLRRLALKRYLKQVHEAIERRKFLPGNGDLSGLIGNVLYSFSILQDDTFTNIRLKRSSGDTHLDSAARRAIIAASGMTKRPKILKGQCITITIAVKYQYSM